MPNAGDEPARILEQAVRNGLIAGASAQAGTSSAVLASWAVGRAAARDDAAAIRRSTRFDLASLTKVLATTTLALDHVAEGTLSLDDRLANQLPAWSGRERDQVTFRHLLEHSSGLPAHRPYFERLAGRPAYEHAIVGEPLESAPGTVAVYSDLGFILLGFVLEDATGKTLSTQFGAWQDRHLDGPTSFAFAPVAPDDVACSEYDERRGHLLCGAVHDGNAAALGGAPGHAGLFGSVHDVALMARWWLQRLASTDDDARGRLARVFAQPSTVPHSSRALGWDTMRPSSSCGASFSAAALGHTGFTGTSLWIDPGLDRYVVLLANRVAPFTRADEMQQVRRNFHGAVLSAHAATAGSRRSSSAGPTPGARSAS